MGIETKLHNVLFILILPILSICCFIACNNKYSEIENKTSVTETDSILVWIESGRNKSNSKAIRKENLLKAYGSTNSKKVDSIKLKYLSKIQWSFLGVQDSAWFRKTNREANVLAEKVGDSLRLGGSYWDLAEFLNRNKVKDSAYFHFSRAQKVYQALGNNLNAGKLEYDMARIQADVKNYTSAEVGTVKAIELLKPLAENIMLYRCYNLLGVIAKDLEEYERSLEYYNTANSYLKKSNVKSQLEQEIENNIGVAYQEMGEHKKAAPYFEKVLNRDGLSFKNPGYYARTLNNLAKSQYRANPKTNVESLFLESLKIRDSIGDIAGLAGGSVDFSQYYFNKNSPEKALENAFKAKSYAEQSSNNERLLQSLDLLIKLDPSNASSYGQRYMSLNDSLQLEERKIRNKFARIRFETDEVVAENQMLAREKRLWAGIAISILLLGTAGYVIIDQRSKNQKLQFQQEQQVSDEKIFNLMLSEKQKFEEGKKLEQKRISEELHDGILGKMLGARMVLTGLNKKANQEAITERAEAIVALKDVEGEVRSISHELSHSAYQEMHNFIRSIRDLLQNIGNSAGINHTFNYAEEIHWDDLKGDIKINVYRILQESLQNAVKHAKCNNLVVDFSNVNDQIQVLVKDDGIGFDFGKRKRGIGMRNIESRIKKLNGSWHIDSKLGRGTTLKLTIPIEYFLQEPQIFDNFETTEKV